MMQRSLLFLFNQLRFQNLRVIRSCHVQKSEDIPEIIDDALLEKDLEEYIDEKLAKDARKMKSLIEPGGATQEAAIAPFLKPTFNISAYLNKSETLKKFHELGVDFYKIEKRKGLGQFFLELDFERHVKDHLLFLKDVGVSPDLFGEFITKNPLIFKESIADLQTRVNYLQSKKFTTDMIVRIVEKNPFWLMFSTKRIDRRLGFFQKTFGLKGYQVRELATKQPKLITYSLDHVRENIFGVHTEMGFDKDELRELVLGKPKIFMMNKEELLNRFEYVHHKMKLSHETITKSPEVLLIRQFKIRQRHEFLKSLKKDQYDPKKPLYVPLFSLVTGSDEDFVIKVAKSCMEEYEKFIKSL